MKSWKKYVTALCTAALTYIIIGGTISAGGQERTDGKHTDFDGVVRLDMAAQGTGVDSYNVSVAAGIILYEIQSQRAAQNV